MRTEIRDLLLLLSFFAIAVWGIVHFHARTVPLLIALSIGAAVSLSLWHEKQDVLLFALAGILGPSMEILCIRAGAWTYARQDFLGIPMWLPLVWALSLFFLARVARTLARLTEKPHAREKLFKKM